MFDIYKSLIRPLFFKLDPELSHEIACSLLSIVEKSRFSKTLIRKIINAKGSEINICGINFPNRIGLAAGFDKNGLFPGVMSALGFGHVEIGTVTPEAQKGNPKPRLYRVPEEKALINRMGFNNHGVDALKKRVSVSFPKNQRQVPLGINLGKGKTTPLELALEDYCAGFDATAHLADYITINISSPNTPDLRKLQSDEFLDPLLSGIKDHRTSWAKLHNMPSPPCLLKISPDESFKSIETIISKAVDHQFDGIIACNTSIKQTNQFSKNITLPKGGISGKPLENKANEVIKFVSRLTNSKLPIIGSGGIYDYDSAQRKLDAGACLLQIYTSFIFNGPLWPSRLAKRIPLAKEW